MTVDAQSPIFGAVPENRLPEQDAEKILLLGEKFRLSAIAQSKWAERAREAIKFLEGEQWTEEQQAWLAQHGRVAMTFNKIAPLYRLVMGYHANNRIDLRFLPGHDGSGTKEISEVLTRIAKQVSEVNLLSHEDGQAFSDGLTTGRGWWRNLLDFSENDFGEIRIRSVDPFTVYPDPDADTYDLNESANYIQSTRWASYDEIEWSLGKNVADLVKPFTRGQAWNGFPTLYQTPEGEIAAERTFAEEEDMELGSVGAYRDLFHEHFIDPARKNIRILETEYKITRWQNVFIDLETGDRKAVPDHWHRQQIEKVLYHAQQSGNPVTVRRRPVQRVRWTISVGDILIHDDWSPYESFTYTPYFPYFRRGKTRGIIEDLIDPQKEYNKRRMTRSEIQSRIANGGWMYSDDALDTQQKANLKKFGSSPGVNVEFKKAATQPPKQIEGQNVPSEHARLEEAANQDLHEISGINESSLGQVDKVQSGRAIEARQRQAVIGLQMYIDNFTRSKELQGRKILNMVQQHYTEERVFRIVGEDGNLVQSIINQPQQDGVGRFIGKLNDVTVGKYSVAVNETPMAATFQNAQFEEALTLINALGPILGPALPALAERLVEMSSLPRKDEFKEDLRAALGGGTAIGGSVAVPGEAIPPGEEGNAPSLVEGNSTAGTMLAAGE